MIQSWDANTRRGVVFGAFDFDSSMVDEGVGFLAGEVVAAELWGERRRYTLKKVIKESYRRQGKIAGHECKGFEPANQGYERLTLLERSSSTLRVEASHGDAYTATIEVVFNHPSHVDGFEGEFDFESPWFRYATEEEIGSVDIPEGHHAYYIVGTEFTPDLKAGALVIAKSFSVTKAKIWPTDY